MLACVPLFDKRIIYDAGMGQMGEQLGTYKITLFQYVSLYLKAILQPNRLIYLVERHRFKKKNTKKQKQKYNNTNR